MLGRPRILSLFLNSFKKFNKIASVIFSEVFYVLIISLNTKFLFI